MSVTTTSGALGLDRRRGARGGRRTPRRPRPSSSAARTCSRPSRTRRLSSASTTRIGTTRRYSATGGKSCLHPRHTPAGVIAASDSRSRRRCKARSSQQPRDRARTTVGVVTVDDQAVFRRVAREVIEATDGFESLGEACSGEEALRLADEVDPDLVLVDVRMPGMDGVETASRLAAAHPTSTIVLVSSEDRAALPAGVECCGAAALLCKEEFGTTALRRLWALHGPGESRPAPR